MKPVCYITWTALPQGFLELNPPVPAHSTHVLQEPEVGKKGGWGLEGERSSSPLGESSCLFPWSGVYVEHGNRPHTLGRFSILLQPGCTVAQQHVHCKASWRRKPLWEREEACSSPTWKHISMLKGFSSTQLQSKEERAGTDSKHEHLQNDPWWVSSPTWLVCYGLPGIVKWNYSAMKNI